MITDLEKILLSFAGGVIGALLVSVAKEAGKRITRFFYAHKPIVSYVFAIVVLLITLIIWNPGLGILTIAFLITSFLLYKRRKRQK